MLIDFSYGFLSLIPFKTITDIGKSAGSAALLVGGLACLYYVLREAYIRLKRKNIAFSAELENGFKKCIQIFRHIHPICGVLVFILILSHAYILWYVTGLADHLPLYSGLFALFSLGIVTALGISIVRMPSFLQLRKYHRLLASVLVAFVMLHLIFV